MDVEAFIARWTAREGGAERANYQMFLSELCDVLGVDRPEPAGAERAHNDYVFERAVRPRASDGGTAPKRIDLYRKDAFILEAKQSRLPGAKNAIPGQLSLLPEDTETLGRRIRGPAWDVMMQNARKQAEGYVFLLDANHPAPPFIITCDVGHCLEVYADFSGTGRAYNQFPDRKGFRIYMDDLRRPEVRQELSRIWTDPHSLDPTKTSARVTREIAKRLAEVSKALEARGCNAEHVAHFLMRCLFTMFAEDTDLLPKDSFRALLEKSVDDPSHFPHRLKTLWEQMERGEEFSHVIEARVRHFNGGLFKDTTVFELEREEIGELVAAAAADWKLVDPAIFGTLLEQALDKTERRKLGAHYTPRSYVQRLVEVTVMEPLRADWQAALTKAEQARDDKDDKQAIALVRAFHHQLCTTRVLDPACGTGNFLYVALEMMKQLEGDVLQTLTDLGDVQANLVMTGAESVDPHQFLGLELNPRAAAIAELVIWIGYLQWHYRNHLSHPAEPILRAFQNINFGHREGYDAVLTWDGYPVPAVVEVDGKRVEAYPNPRRPVWPEAEFIVGNPPFLGKGKDMRDALTDGYVNALFAAHPTINESADFVMYWWDVAAEKLAARKTPLVRFGLVSTNSIRQTFDRRVVERHLAGKSPLALVFAVPDHPWTKATKDAASVRIAMTVAQLGQAVGDRLEIVSERYLDTDEPVLEFKRDRGRVNADLSIGADLTKTVELNSNRGLSWNGVMLAGRGFVLSRAEADDTISRFPNEKGILKKFISGMDLVQRPRVRYVVDTFGLSESTFRRDYPALYGTLLQTVKPERDTKRDTQFKRDWWLFGRTRPELRQAVSALDRFIGLPETAKHREFQFIDTEYLPEHRIVCIALDDGFSLAILSSRYHKLWSLAAGGTLEDRPVYNKSRCFDPFPLPDPDPAIKENLRALGEELDATRKFVLSEYDDLTLTGLYNLLGKVVAGEPLSPSEEDAKQRGRILILKELHDQIDGLTAKAYGWPPDLAEQEILERLAIMNAERAKEEATGKVRWLRPEYQVSRFAKGAQAKSGELNLGGAVIAIDKGLPAFPTDRYEQPLAVEAMLAASATPMGVAEISRGFKRGGKRIEQRVGQVLTTLVRYGRVVALEDGRYAARRAA